jgi:putative spermidine/putrescine transport system ATP-binding protein
VDVEELSLASAPLVLRGIGKTYGGKAPGRVAALDHIDLDVRSGELLTILGPSGSGKTTMLKVIAGFELPDAGSVTLAGADITTQAAGKRNIGMVFQNYALFPHMTVAGNVAFPLEMRGVARADITRRVDAAIELVGLGGFAKRLPRQLSGGQQQRVAFARAVVFEPQLLLLDEPFGALDRKLREAMQLEMRALQRRLGITTVFITHDQEEALVLSDRIAVMHQGRIEQIGAPAAIYEHPASVFTADFIGESNIFQGTIQRHDNGRLHLALENGLSLQATGLYPDGARIAAVIRPERVRGEATENPLEGTVSEAVYVGNACKLRLRLAGGVEVLARLPADGGMMPAMGDSLTLFVAARDIHLLSLPT